MRFPCSCRMFFSVSSGWNAWRSVVLAGSSASILLSSLGGIKSGIHRLRCLRRVVLIISLSDILFCIISVGSLAGILPCSGLASALHGMRRLRLQSLALAPSRFSVLPSGVSTVGLSKIGLASPLGHPAARLEWQVHVQLLSAFCVGAKRCSISSAVVPLLSSRMQDKGSSTSVDSAPGGTLTRPSVKQEILTPSGDPLGAVDPSDIKLILNVASRCFGISSTSQLL